MKFIRYNLKCRDILVWEDFKYQNHSGKRAKLGDYFVFQLSRDCYFPHDHDKPYALISYLPGIRNDISGRFASVEEGMNIAEQSIKHWIERAGLCTKE